MIYKITYIKREIVNAFLPNQRVNDSEEMTIEINAIDTNKARKLFYSDENNIHCFIKLIERTTPKPKKSRGAKTNQKELVKRQEKKLLKKEKTKRWLEKHPESDLAKKFLKKV